MYPSSSYDGANTSAMVSAVSTNCTGAVASGACELWLPPVSGYRYRVDVYNMSARDAAEGKTPLDVRKRAAARFLMHTTFGPTRQELTNLTAWLTNLELTNLTLTSLRAQGQLLRRVKLIWRHRHLHKMSTRQLPKLKLTPSSHPN